jgi:hypothetical protein
LFNFHITQSLATLEDSKPARLAFTSAHLRSVAAHWLAHVALIGDLAAYFAIPIQQLFIGIVLDMIHLRIAPSVHLPTYVLFGLYLRSTYTDGNLSI